MDDEQERLVADRRRQRLLGSQQRLLRLEQDEALCLGRSRQAPGQRELRDRDHRGCRGDRRQVHEEQAGVTGLRSGTHEIAKTRAATTRQGAIAQTPAASAIRPSTSTATGPPTAAAATAMPTTRAVAAGPTIIGVRLMS